jgi:PAS domain S-box-containing protein
MSLAGGAFLLIGILVLSCAIVSLARKKRGLELTLSELRGKDDTELTNKIRLSKQQLETTFDAITDFICAIDADYTVVRVNKSYADFVKLDIRRIIGRRCHEVFWGLKAPCDRCPARTTFAKGAPVLKQHFTMRNADGVRRFDVGTYPVGPIEGKPVNVIEHIRDVTDERNIMDQLIRSEKLATIGTMTAGIAHEMINPLSGISGTVTNMLQFPQKYGLNEKGIQRVTALRDAASRATMIMKDLLHLSLTDINAIIMKAVNAVQLKGFPPLEYKLMLDQLLTKVLCDPLKIEQVIINIVTNAIQSIVEKKETLALQGTQYSGLIIISTQQFDEMVHIDIIDNGAGISEENKNKIFDPFFTTRAPGEGTGLGLSLCLRIIEEHNGRIVVESNKGLTTFSIILPAQPGVAPIVL